MNSEILFRQLFEIESSTYTYILADPYTKEAVIIDPVLETWKRDLRVIQDLNLHLLYIIDTHVHADHITGAAELKRVTGAKTVVSKSAQVKAADLELGDEDVLAFGGRALRALATPGHTDSCMSLVCDGMVFTGDALLIRGNGRTDFQQGSAERLYHSVHQKIFALPDQTKIYPAHDYKGRTSSTVGEEKSFNPGLALNKSKQQFVQYMADKDLPLPKKVKISVPANLKGGTLSGHSKE